MAISVTHATQSVVVDDAVAGEVGPSEWNEAHTVTGAVDTATQVIAGAGLSGGGDLSANRTFDVGAGTGITVNANDVALDTTNARNVDHTAVTLTAGAGLTGGGDISANRTFTVGAGTGITVNADDVAVDTTVVTPTTRTLTAGAGLTGGGDLTANRTFDVGAGAGISVAADSVALDLTHVSNAAHPGTAADSSITIYNSTDGSLKAQNNAFIASDGTLIVGQSTTPLATSETTAELQVQGTTIDSSAISLFRFVNTGGHGRFSFAKSRGTTLGSHVVVNHHDILGEVLFDGSNGTDFRQAASVRVECDASPAGNSVPGRLMFFTTTVGDTDVSCKLKINNAGNVFISNMGDEEPPDALDAARKLHVREITSATNTVVPVARFGFASSGTPAAGLGTSLEFEVETAADNYEVGATIEAVTTDVTSTSEDFDVVLKIMAAGAAVAEKLRVKSDGQVITTARIEEPVVTLADAANVTLNSALGNLFFLAAGGDRTIDAPTNAPAAGRTQKIVIRHEGTGAARTLTLAGGAGGFRFGTDITGLTQTASGVIDYIGAIWNQPDNAWDIVSYVKGF